MWGEKKQAFAGVTGLRAAGGPARPHECPDEQEMLYQGGEALRGQRLGGGATSPGPLGPLAAGGDRSALGPPEGAQPHILESRLASRTLASRHPGGR